MSKIVVALSFAILCLGAVARSDAPKNPPPHDPPYPARWWAPVDDPKKPGWEILPQEAQVGEVILSKRNELGILSNFASTPFTYHGKTFASVEGFWQSTKYPENDKDPRWHFPGVAWAHTRAEVENMTAFDAKHAGDVGSENMKKMKIDWVSVDGRHMIYKEPGESAFYKVIVEVMKAKLDQNAKVREILLETGNLKLRADHHEEADAQKAWRYFDIWMMLRERLKAGARSVAATN